MQTRRHSKKLSPAQRELYRRCVVLMLASLFFFIMAAVRVHSADSYRQDPDDAWAFPEEDDDDVMSYDDHALAARLKRNVVGTRPVYTRKKASQVHDAVTIVINEETASELTSSNDLKRDSSNNVVLESWVTPRLWGTTQHGAAAGGSSPTLAYNSSRKHKSDSTIDRTQTFTTTLTGEVVWVHSNGYLVIEARKSVNVNGEEQTVKLTGTVNPNHMDSKSTVDAKYLMDMAIVYKGSGPMTRMDKRGWGARIIDFLNPF